MNPTNSSILPLPHCIRFRGCFINLNKPMSIAGRSSDFGIIRSFRLPTIINSSGCVFAEKNVLRYSGGTVLDLHQLPKSHFGFLNLQRLQTNIKHFLIKTKNR